MATVLETRDLKKHYQMGGSTVRALDGVSITVEQGSSSACWGPPDPGKSTLLNLIAGLDRPSEGRCASSTRTSRRCPAPS